MSRPDSKSSTLAVREPPVVHRQKSVFGALQRFIEANDTTGIGRLSFLMTSFVDELADELGDKDEAAMRLYMAQIGEVIAWIGHGDNSRLPEYLREFAEAIQPSAFPAHTINDVRVAERDSSREPDSKRIVGDTSALASTPET